MIIFTRWGEFVEFLQWNEVAFFVYNDLNKIGDSFQMSIFSFSFLKEAFGGSKQLTAKEQQEMFEELLFLVLSRASRSDLDISEVEVSKIAELLKSTAGIEANEQEIRTAGMSELYEVASLEKYVSRASKSLSDDQCYKVVSALYDVITADGKVNAAEADFFDSVIAAMELRPIQLLGAKIEE